MLISKFAVKAHGLIYVFDTKEAATKAGPCFPVWETKDVTCVPIKHVVCAQGDKWYIDNNGVTV